MGWIGRLWKKIHGDAPVDMIVGQVSTTGFSGVGQPINPDDCYVELYVESLRLTAARKFATRFNGVVYSFVSLSREGDTKAQLAAVSKPEKLAELSSDSLDKVITVSKQMMGAVPWRGGPLGLELGLFSVKTGNLLTPILEYVTKVSSAAGVSFVGTVKPFVPLITEGMDLLAGQTDDTTIEVAIDTDITLTTSGVYALIAAPKGSVDLSKVLLDSADHKLLLDGNPLNHGYCVFSIRRALQKADYGEIPELKEKYGAIQTAIKANKIRDAQDALTAFRLATIASPDLISSDARKLVEKAEEKVKEAFMAGGVSKEPRDAPMEALSDIGLYQ
jgi:hypothetical protein